MVIWRSRDPHIPAPRETFNQMLINAMESHIAANPNAIAMIRADVPTAPPMTYKGLLKLSKQIAFFLNSRGFGHGSIGSIMMSNCPEFVSFVLGSIICGGVYSPVNPFFLSGEIQRQLRNNGSVALFVEEDILETALKAVENTSVKIIVCLRNTTNTLPSGVVDFEEIRNLPDNISHIKPEISLDDMCTLPYSSGTTGFPKGVIMTHRNVSTMIAITALYFKKWNDLIGEDSRHILLQQPICHGVGFLVCFNAIINGASMVYLSRVDPIVFLTCIHKFKFRQIYVVPPLLVLMVKNSLVAKFDLSSIKVAFCGGAPLGKQLAQAFMRRFPHCRIYQCYGMTETGTSSHVPDLFDSSYSQKNYESCGNVCSTFEVKIVDPETYRELGPGETGEIVVRGPTVMQGYYNNPESTKHTIRNGWLYTGDIGRADKEGRFYIVDRLKELIKVRSIQVPPAMLEDLLLEHPKIADAGVVGMPDFESGELPFAFVVRRSPDLTAEEVKAHVAEHVAGFECLHGGVEFVDQIPRSPSGKILRRYLKEKLKEICNRKRA
ncbi:unnamed protein product [Caenorhabditis auriculariae]|uniref:Uncharacterized protein n=1 Tax=Caenorhabditis auriculariae TaxID=2777116 RepID=A0A8S1H9D1_9PELO|nr:unnamed protein product [Caenorhabditis auriculariae]